MKRQQQALKDIKKIADENNLTLADISKAFETTGEKSSGGSMIEASELLAYMGGILIFAGIGIYTTLFWPDLSTFARIALTFGSGFSCYCVALGLSQSLQQTKAIHALFFMGALLETTGLYVFLNEVFVTSSDAHLATLFVFGVMFVQQFATFWGLRLNLLLFFALFFGWGFFYTLFDYMAINMDFILIGLGISLFCITYALNSMNYQPALGFWYFIATSMILSGAYDWFYKKPFEIAFVGLCTFMIYLSTLVKSKAVLFASTIALLGYIGYYTVMHFVDSIGWPIALILIGICFIFLSGLALKLQKRFSEGSN
jgi:hypothetical protein